MWEDENTATTDSPAEESEINLDGFGIIVEE